jgi:homogentisate phytyltransferase/homogentisate geranylgeranyltransferase
VIRGPLLLWRFGRPHTMVGTALSVLGIFALVSPLPAWWDLVLTLMAAWAVNVFITGINQLEDVEIDEVNKPFLPVAAGDLSPRAGRRIVVAAAVIPIALAATQGLLELGAVLAALAVGVAYSVQPLRLKRWPVLAALSISGVRSIVVNLGVALHFTGGGVPQGVWALTAFVLPFSAAIALFKDVPDIEGDRRFHIATFSVRLGGAVVLRAGLALLVVAYVGMAIAGFVLLDDAQPVVLAVTHLAALGVALAAARRTDVADRADFTRFYLLVWKLFFLEYLIVPLAYALS